MVVFSAFDGMACGRLALDRCGIVPDVYFSSEVDKHAIQVATDNFKDIRQLGDINNLSTGNLPNVDLLIGGSPCQGFSSAGKGLNFEDPRSKLFFKFVELKDELRPKYFLLENVVMKKAYQDIISSYLGVEPILINSRLVSAQNRNRLYWTNIPDICQPANAGVSFTDICDTPGWFAGSMIGRRVNEYGHRDDYNKSIPIVQYIASRVDDKTNCLSTVAKDTIVSDTWVKRKPATEVNWRYLTRAEMEKLQTLPVGYTKSVSLSQAAKMMGNGWTVDVISHIFKNIQ